MPYSKTCIKKKKNEKDPNNKKPPTNSLKLKYRIISNQVQYGSKKFLGKSLCESSIGSEVALAKRFAPAREGNKHNRLRRALHRCPIATGVPQQLVLVLLVHTQHHIPGFGEEPGEAALPCLQTRLRLLSERGSGALGARTGMALKELF